MNQWLEDSSCLIGENLLAIYKIGSFGTAAFSVHSDIDLIYILNAPLPSAIRDKIRFLTNQLKNEALLDVHFIVKEDIGYDLNAPDPYLISCCLAWQGECLRGSKLAFKNPDEEITLTFHGIKILKSLMKSAGGESERLNLAIFYAIQVLDKQIDWKDASTKTSLKRFIPLKNWNLDLAKDACRSKLDSWNLPEALKNKLDSFL